MPQELSSFSFPAAALPFASGVQDEIAPVDEMFAGNLRHYFETGASALNCILCAVQLAGRAPPGRILDFGCGAGRVTRWLRAAYPQAEIQGCEIERLEECLRFQREKLHVVTWNSVVSVQALQAPTTYDLVWVGSVFTHLSADTSRALFDKLASWLEPGGLLVFSVHGRRAIARDQADTSFYGLQPQERAQALDGYAATGYGYSDYTWAAESGAGYGISFSKSEWWVRFLESRPRTRLICMSEAAWDQHHDVIAVQKASLEA